MVCAVDVGSLLNIGWWRAPRTGSGSGGRDLDSLVATVANDLAVGRRVALGFEAPLFIPMPTSTAGLNRQRVGERGRPWCAGAGTGALALGLQQAAYVFAGIAAQCVTMPEVSFDPATLLSGEAELVVWEAFVSGKSKNRSALEPHVDDARVAVNEFWSRLAAGTVDSDIDEPKVLNLAAGGLLATGLANDITLLRQPCVVVKAPELLSA